MPNIKSAIRRVRKSRKQASINRIRKSKYRSTIKEMSIYLDAGKMKEAKKILKSTLSKKMKSLLEGRSQPLSITMTINAPTMITVPRSGCFITNKAAATKMMTGALKVRGSDSSDCRSARSLAV